MTEEMESMANKISMALKDSLLQLGFEIICKKINELEAENAGLKAGKPIWHKVADGDLPKVRKDYLCKVRYYKSEETFYAVILFKTERNGFLFEEDDDDVTPFDVVEWCELPKHEEE